MKILDSISFEYWHKNNIKLDSKSYYSDHNGYRYGDGMQGKSTNYIIGFSHKLPNGTVKTFTKYNNSKENYFLFVKELCNYSKKSFEKYRNAKAEKNGIFSQEQVDNMTETKKGSTRIKSDRKLIINGSVWYAASNLKISEYINAAYLSMDEDERPYWNILLIDTEISINTGNNDISNTDISYTANKFELTVEEAAIPYIMDKKNTQKKSPQKLDYINIAVNNQKTGDLGEEIVMTYERNRLFSAGRDDLAKKVQRISNTDDTAGYDIHSFNDDGTDLYIEVKSTKENAPGRFFLSENERCKSVELGTQWVLYRVFSINTKKGTASLMIYNSPITDTAYEMKPTTWFIRGRK